MLRRPVITNQDLNPYQRCCSESVLVCVGPPFMLLMVVS